MKAAPKKREQPQKGRNWQPQRRKEQPQKRVPQRMERNKRINYYYCS